MAEEFNPPVDHDGSRDPQTTTGSVDEEANLEDTANDDNCHIDFHVDSSMPSIIDLATAGLRQSPRIAIKQSDKNHSSLSCNTIMKCFCVFLYSNGITVNTMGKLFAL